MFPSYMMNAVRSDSVKKFVIFIGVLMGGVLIMQILLTLEHLFESVQRLPEERAVREMELFKSQSNAARQTIRHSNQNFPSSDSANRVSDSQLRFTREYIESSNMEIQSIYFPSYLQEYMDCDLSSKKALLDLQQWLYEHKYPVPLFQDRFSSPGNTLPPPKVCIAITTANRPQAPFLYLIQTVSALLNRMNYAKYKDQVYVHVFNVDADPAEHKEAQIVSQFVPVTHVKQGVKEEFPLPRKYQENLDNAEVMRRVNSLQCEYPILIEDDALAKNDWMDSILVAIRQMEKYERDRREVLSSKLAPWLMVKLYCAREDDLVEVPPEGVNMTYFQRWNTVAMMMNRQYLLNVSQHLETRVNDALAEYNFTKPIAKDEDIDNWRNVTGLTGMCFEPVVFQHTGVFSSVENRQPDPESVQLWYMKSKYFEAEGKPVLFDKSQWDPLLK